MIVQDIITQYSHDIPAKDLRLLLQKILNISDEDWITSQQMDVMDIQAQMIEKIAARRIQGEPVARIFREWEFWGLNFHLSADTLVPRPDTETLIEAVLKTCPTPPTTILDLGTGSGCILISLLHEYTGAFGVGVDVSEGALKTARRNAVHNNVFNRCQFICADWSEPLQGAFDVIVSNPPYIESDVIHNLQPEVRGHDPILALDGGEDGLDSIKILLNKIKSCMSEKTFVFFEIGYNQADSVMKLIEEFGFSTRKVHKDLAGHNRVIEFTHGDNNKKIES